MTTITDTIGAAYNSESFANYLFGSAITASNNGTLISLGINIGTPSGNIRLALYSTLSGGVFSGLLGQSADTVAITGWNDLAIAGSVPIVGGTTYYIAVVHTGSETLYNTDAIQYFVSYGYGAFSDPSPSLGTRGPETYNMRMSYTSSSGNNYTHTFTNNIGSLDSRARIGIKNRILNGNLGIKDTKSRVFIRFRTLVSNLGNKDTRSRISTRVRTLTNTIGVMDTLSKIHIGINHYIHSFTNYIGIKDTRSRIATRIRSLSSNLGLHDIKTKVYGRARILLDYIGAKGSYIRGTATRVRSFSSNLGVKDSKTRVKSYFRILTNRIGLLDSKVRVYGRYRVFYEFIGVRDRIYLKYHKFKNKYWNKEHPKQYVSIS